MMYYVKGPSVNAVVSRAIIEIVLVVLITYPLIHLYVFVQGNIEATHRGFFCDDETLKYPMVPDTISNNVCLIIWTIFVLSIVPGIEILHCLIFSNMRPMPHPFSRLPRSIFEIYRTMGYCFIGGLFTLVVTEMAKHQVGRLRPYFLTVCQPNVTQTEGCKDDEDMQVFVTNYTCDGNPKEVRDGRKSFFSGHTSFSFYCATFLIIYLQTRLNYHQREQIRTFHAAKRGLKIALRLVRIFQPFVQFGIFLLAVHISLTRITDYKHHASDVLAGMILGAIVAITVSLFLLNLRKYPNVFFQIYQFEESEMDGRLKPRSGHAEDSSKM